MRSFAALLFAAASCLAGAPQVPAGAVACRGRNLALTLPAGYHCARSASDSDLVTGWSSARSDLHVSLLPPWAAEQVREFPGTAASESRVFHKALEVSARARGLRARLSPMRERALLNGAMAQYFTEGGAGPDGRRALHAFVDVGPVVYHVYSVLPRKGPHGPDELFRILGSLGPPPSGGR